MKKTHYQTLVCSLGCLLLIYACKQKDNVHTGWSIYRGDAYNTAYSGLDQINKENVSQLEVAWTYHTGDAEAGKILAIGKSTAEAYELAVKALGGENFTRYKITEELSKGHVKLIPDVLIGGNGNGNAMEGLLGLKLMEMMDPEKNKGKSEPST